MVVVVDGSLLLSFVVGWLFAVAVRCGRVCALFVLAVCNYCVKLADGCRQQLFVIVWLLMLVCVVCVYR